jgi:glutamate synthase domain-containing protein 2
LAGRIRYLFEAIRPEINQYFVESNSDGKPFSREQRSIVYQRAKKQLDTLPFGTQLDVYESGYEWIHHSMAPVHVDPKALRVVIGNAQCKQPYNASIFNISAMSYGALSKNAVLALNGGAKDGNFAHNTGEGGLSPYHLAPGGDVIWQIGTGYFGCRAKQGGFDPGLYKENAQRPSVKMIELKISQGAKPGHGGILPARKVTEEIARIRHVPMGQDVNSPPAHSAFSTPVGMLEFIAQLRELSGGKPVGFKICVGKRREFFAVCKAMLKTGIYPDYIAIDGGEGGTGAAPLEFSNHMGMPSVEGLIFVHNALVGLGIRQHMRIFSAGKLLTAFEIVKRMALGADLCYSARGMMLALGCIQALRCNANVCPAGVATSDPYLVEGLVPGDKRIRVKNYHEETVKAVAECLGAMGVSHTSELRPWNIMHRVGREEVRHYAEIYNFLEEGELLRDQIPEAYGRAFRAAAAESFGHNGEEYIPHH